MNHTVPTRRLETVQFSEKYVGVLAASVDVMSRWQVQLIAAPLQRLPNIQ